MKLIRKFIDKLTFKNIETDVEIVNRLFDEIAYEQFQVDMENIFKEANERSKRMHDNYDKSQQKHK